MARPNGRDLTLINQVSKTRNHKPVATMFTPVKTSDQTIHRFSDVFKIMADKSRLKILLALAQDGELHVTALCDLLGQSQPAVSHHLTLMRMTGLVGYRRDGKHNYYYLQSSVLRDLIEQFFSDSGSGGKNLQFEDFSLAYKRK
jgi:DNA-binding transcriptional ArsR family regulator